jgi:cytochrome d ubiquinol oxidase subunit I
MGRQPWIVFQLMLTEKGVSAVVAPGIVLASLVGFTLIYGVLMVADVYLLAKYARARTQDIGNDVVPDWDSGAGVIAPKPASTGAR